VNPIPQNKRIEGMYRYFRLTLLSIPIALGSTTLFAHEEPPLVVIVKSSRADLQGIADSASEGIVTKKQFETRPLLRAGDLMEVVPGLVATQHAGEGKANQYFLRGFNLDHGTDFATFVDGAPVNLPTHGHGQGYTDLNFLIPELVETVRFRKGPYYADDGDFSSVGSIRFRTVRSLISPLGVVQVGQYGYARALGATSFKLGNNNLLVAAEQVRDAGPWLVNQNLRKTNLVTKLSQGTDNDGWAIGLNHNTATWTSTDQVPERAITSGLISRFGSLDPTAGGRTSRTGLTAEWAKNDAGVISKVNAWANRYSFDLFSNFTYFSRGCDAAPLPSQCDGPIALDQFEQTDRRKSFGLTASQQYPINLWNNQSTISFGTDIRRDNISNVGLYDTFQRTRLATVREDRARIDAYSLWSQFDAQFTKGLRGAVGLRWDHKDYAVNSSVAANSGQVSASLLSPKASLVYSLDKKNDFYFNWGRGFHSNDARGAVAKVDPRDGVTPITSATPLVKTTGFEVGSRQKWGKSFTTTAALWQLSLASELLFVGDAGTTEASRPSVRRGFELTSSWRPTANWEIDSDISLSRARFKDNDPAGNLVPGAIGKVASIGATYVDGPWTVGARVRHLGGRALTEDNSVRAAANTMVNLRTSYRINKNAEVSMDIFNLFNRKANDIEYAYASRLPFEAPFSDGVTPATKHVHPSLPRMIRMGLKLNF
jgi:outer membrane receptor protein involved in Fe transport